MSKERRLGRGLEALLGRVAEPASAVGAAARTEASKVDAQSAASPTEESPAAPAAPADLPGGICTRDDAGQAWLDVYSIDRNPFQPRQVFDESELRSLVESIQAHGVLQPLVVRRVENRFQLIMGERRLRAATAAGWERVPVQIRDANDRQMAELAIVENIQRKDLNPLEKATSFVRYLDDYQCSKEELAARINVDRSTISNLCRLLELPDSVQKMIRAERISQGHARALLPLGEPEEQVKMSERICRDGLSVRATEEAVTQRVRRLDAEPLAIVGADGQRRALPRSRSAHLASLEQELRGSLGTKVDVKQSSRGRGKITIHFNSRDEFDRIRGLLSRAEKEAVGG